MRETDSARLLAQFLAERGFRVEFPIRSVPTAFKATAGKGRPVVGFLGEYDALPDCGLDKGTYGHGCGHNLLGVGSALGAVATARLLADQGKAGRVVYWGCPAEEELTGKVYMARDGAFRGLDACLAWHPGNSTATSAAGGAAMDSLVYEFFGRTAHAASAHGGRSALDAALLMDVAVNYMREHMPDNVRIHCVVPAGGSAPNVVPEYARIWYYVRGKDRAQVDEMTGRLLLCAKGAATATETKFKVRRLTGVYNRLRNPPLADLVQKNLLLFGTPRATAPDRERLKDLFEKPEFNLSVRRDISQEGSKASSDECNVSWLTPLGCFGMVCTAKDSRGHHRDYTFQTNLPFAYRGMLRAAEVMAGTAWDLFTQPALLKRVRTEFAKGTKGFSYDPLVPRRQRPPVKDQ
jgi:aminobenzoyl-glutamate utilization protein B